MPNWHDDEGNCFWDAQSDGLCPVCFPDGVRDGGCPCLLVEPCSRQCTCANPGMSGGCRRCCAYGSLEQRTAKARRLVKLLERDSKK